MPKTKLVRLGNSLAVRIPKAVVAQAGLQEGDLILIKMLDSRIELHRVERIPTLDELVARITPENRYGETMWGPTVIHSMNERNPYQALERNPPSLCARWITSCPKAGGDAGATTSVSFENLIQLQQDSTQRRL